MPWCPECKNEYREGITTCADCSISLVDSLEDINKRSISNEEYETDGCLQAIDESDAEEAQEDYNSLIDNRKPSSVYVKKEDKYKDTLSSAYTLLIVGFIGLLLLLLVVTNVINLNLASPGKYITYSGIGIMLIIFIIIGFVSLNTAKRLAVEASHENQLTDDILDWFSKSISADLIETGITDDMSEEIKYFKRFENIKKLIVKTYGELNEGYIDKLADDIYQKQFDVID